MILQPLPLPEGATGGPAAGPIAGEPHPRGWGEFARHRLLGEDGVPARGSPVGEMPRLCDAPRRAQCFHARHRSTCGAAAPDRADTASFVP